jgi:hypothetical protein
MPYIGKFPIDVSSGADTKSRRNLSGFDIMKSHFIRASLCLAAALLSSLANQSHAGLVFSTTAAILSETDSTATIIVSLNGKAAQIGDSQAYIDETPQLVSSYGVQVSSSIAGTWIGTSLATVGTDWQPFQKASSTSGNVALFQGGVLNQTQIDNYTSFSISSAEGLIGTATIQINKTNSAQTLVFTTTAGVNFNHPGISGSGAFVGDNNGHPAVVSQYLGSSISIDPQVVTAVPEPGSLLLVGTILGGCGYRLRSRRQAKAA